MTAPGQNGPTWPRITVVTVNLNNAAGLETTIRSVLSQGYPNLEYFVVDGGSVDGSREVIDRYKDRLSWWVSESDEGHFDAMQKGMARATGEVMACLNSDDIYLPGALLTVGTIFREYPGIHWLQGRPADINHDGNSTINVSLRLSCWSQRRFLTFDFRYIQHESTFWRKSLWLQEGGSFDLSYRYSADQDLWVRFFRHRKLYTVNAILGGFRHRVSGQITKSAAVACYTELCDSVVRERRRLDGWDRLGLDVLFLISLVLRPAFQRGIPGLESLYIRLMKLPPVLVFDTETHAWKLRSITRTATCQDNVIPLRSRLRLLLQTRSQKRGR